MSPVELACTFGGATGERLLAAERLVLALPHLFKDQLHEVDLAFRAPVRFLVVVVRVASPDGVVPPSARERLAFWATRAGGRTLLVGALDEDQHGAFRTIYEACQLRAPGIAPAALLEASGRLFTEAGAPPARRRSAVEIPRLSMDATGPGRQALTYDAATRELFVAAPLSPPAGDVIALSLRAPGADLPLVGTGKVRRVRTPEEAGPGKPAGFGLEIAPAPVALHDALAAHLAARPGSELRVAPRFEVRAPVQVTVDGAPGAATAARAPAAPVPVARVAVARVPAARVLAPPAPPAPAPAAHSATLSYASEHDLHRDFLENLSQGGAFVRRQDPPPVGTAVTLKLRLPSGLDLEAAAVVAFVKPGGMGLEFRLDEETQELLSGAIAQISGRPRRALVVDDDALVRAMVADALGEKGFDVLTASDGQEGLRVLSDELLRLDLLVTDVLMPGMDGVEFVRTIRKLGGETDLAIVAVTGRFDPTVEARLRSAGADLALDKSLGPASIARSADAVLERKRKARTQ